MLNLTAKTTLPAWMNDIIFYMHFVKELCRTSVRQLHFRAFPAFNHDAAECSNHALELSRYLPCQRGVGHTEHVRLSKSSHDEGLEQPRRTRPFLDTSSPDSTARALSAINGKLFTITLGTNINKDPSACSGGDHRWPPGRLRNLTFCVRVDMQHTNRHHNLVLALDCDTLHSQATRDPASIPN